MASIDSAEACSICEKKTSALFVCKGCEKSFCLADLNEHVQNLTKELDGIETESDELRQRLYDKRDDSENRLLIEEIDQWENESIKKIKQTAELCRQQIVNRRDQLNLNIENQLNKHVLNLKETRSQKGTNEIDIDQLKQNLKKLKQELDKPMRIAIQKVSSTFIDEIFLATIDDQEPNCIARININMKWRAESITVAGGNGSGSGLHQLSHPQSLHIDDDQTVYIADENNHRIVAWKQGATSGQLVAGLKGKGKLNDQLNDPRYVFVSKEIDSIIIGDTWNTRVMKWPRQNGLDGQIIISNISCAGLILDDEGSIYVTDTKKHEVRRYKLGENTGVVVAGGNGNGSGLNQLNYPTYIIVDKDRSVYVSDECNHRVMKWIEGANVGIVVAGGNGYGSALTQLYNPQGIAVDEFGTVYVSDMYNHRIVRWPRGTSQGNIIAGGNNKGNGSNQLNLPKGLSFDRQGNLYVVDNANSRVQKFPIVLN